MCLSRVFKSLLGGGIRNPRKLLTLKDCKKDRARGELGKREGKKTKRVTCKINPGRKSGLRGKEHKESVRKRFFGERVFWGGI